MTRRGLPLGCEQLAVFGLIVGGVAVAGAVLWRRWRRWNPTQATSEEARAAEFRASTYRDTGGV
jgi:hypothetical protein